MLNLRIALLGAPTSLASIMVVGPHHAAAAHVGMAPKRASGSTWFGKVVTVGDSVGRWSEFLCLGGDISSIEPERQLA
jgi:hypothetical protein